MSLQNIGLFQGIGAKMEYLNQRQTVISQNIANADTPSYRPKDLKEVDFSSFLGAAAAGGKITMAATNPMHLPNPEAELDAKAQKQKKVYEVAPAGNSVVMEEQLLNATQNSMDYNTMLNIYQKQVGMIKTALGTR